MILPLLLHLEYLFLTSLLGFFLLAVMLLLALQILKIYMSNSYAIGVGSMHGEENGVQVVDFGIDRFGRFKFVMDSKDSF